jgi:hypothetical protein
LINIEIYRRRQDKMRQLAEIARDGKEVQRDEFMC